jgi:hypothetical protein
MRMPRFRFTVGRVIAAVAIVAGLWIAERHYRFAKLSDYYADLAPHRSQTGYLTPWGRRNMDSEWSVWSREMEQKYKRAAERPWLPVAPDPPEPPKPN